MMTRRGEAVGGRPGGHCGSLGSLQGLPGVLGAGMASDGAEISPKNLCVKDQPLCQH